LRPQAVDARRTFGHWEGDSMAFAIPGQAALLTLERMSRLVIGRRRHGNAAQPVAEQLCTWFKPIDRRMRRSITLDNGTEFARHRVLNDQLAIKTFFCDPYSPWQKGSIENAIGRLRRALPRKTNLDTIDPELFEAVIAAYNNTPRKCLHFKTPAEVFLAKLLHFERESTMPLLP
jgi:IS30 family transposase